MEAKAVEPLLALDGNHRVLIVGHRQRQSRFGHVLGDAVLERCRAASPSSGMTSGLRRVETRGARLRRPDPESLSES